MTVLVLGLGLWGGVFLLASCGGGGDGDSTPGPIVLVSVNSAGKAGSDSSESPGVSANGRYVVFYSYASNLVDGDTNEDYDVFFHDLETGITSRESVSTAGSEGFGTGGQNASFTYTPAISEDGRFIAFEGEPTNFVQGDNNGDYDIFLRDTRTPLTTRVSVSTFGTEANQGSYNPAISGDGHWVAFESNADNLVPGDTNAKRDIFLHDRQTGTTSRVSVGPAGVEADDNSYEPALSRDGRYVAFYSYAANLVPEDINPDGDVFLRDTQQGITSLVSVSTAGTQGNKSSYNPAISADGRYVAFSSIADNLVSGDSNGKMDVFLRDTVLEATSLVSVSTAGVQAEGGSYTPSISADGRYVAFYSNATNLVPGDTNDADDVFVRDTVMNITARVSVSAAGTEANGESNCPYISADGRYVVFDSYADNLVAETIPEATRQVYRAPVLMP
ncbi:MAG: PD40 domain-containing protein [Proteobacteria bacterium]|nr:PD40 domain-containing protein [Pseudomonadota bacterium]